jgi:hypothetical protein
MSDQASRLPSRPSLEQLRKQAKELLRAYRGGDSSAVARLRAVKPGLSAPGGQQPAALADAQFALAKEYGFESWPKLKRHILITRRPADYHEPTWGRTTWDFFMAIYEGHEDRVREMLRNDPSLARAEYAYLQPLHYAVKAGRISMVELLLAAGANPLAEGWSGRPLGTIRRSRAHEIASRRRLCNCSRTPRRSRSQTFRRGRTRPRTPAVNSRSR